MPTYDKSCLYSTVKNISGVTKTFGYLPPHGKTLAANAETTIFGSIWEAIRRGDRSSGERQVAALLRDIDAGYIEVRETPCPIFDDATLDQPKTLLIDNGAVVVADPCWETSVSV